MNRFSSNFDSHRPLRISLRTRGVNWSDQEKASALELLGHALRRFVHRIRSAEVWLEDVNGPRGGVDIRCRINMQLWPYGRISASALSTTALEALAEVARRARKRIRRRTTKTRTLRRALVRS